MPEGEFEPITSQDQLDKVVGARVARAEAKATADTEARFADYADLQKQVADAAAAADKTKTAEQKLNDRIAALEKDNGDKAVDALRSKVARKFGITDDDQVDLYLTGTDEATLTKQAQGLADLAATRKKNGNRVPGEGRSSSHTDDPNRAFLRQVVGQD